MVGRVTPTILAMDAYERRVVFPAESALLRLVGEQKKLAHGSIVTRIADSFSPEMAETINRLLDIQPEETVSALQKIKANPAKSSAPAMNALMHKMAAIEATGILGIDLSWLNANYQRTMFHYVRKCTADRLRERSLFPARGCNHGQAQPREWCRSLCDPFCPSAPGAENGQ
jgi:hypothetical protein